MTITLASLINDTEQRFLRTLNTYEKFPSLKRRHLLMDEALEDVVPVETQVLLDIAASDLHVMHEKLEDPEMAESPFMSLYLAIKQRLVDKLLDIVNSYTKENWLEAQSEEEKVNESESKSE